MQPENMNAPQDASSAQIEVNNNSVQPTVAHGLAGHTTQFSPSATASPKAKSSKLVWIILVAVLVLVIGGLAYMLMSEKSSHDKTKASLLTEKAETTRLNKEVTFFKGDAAIAAHSPQCGGKDNASDLVLARLNNEPVGGYTAYLTLCRSDFNNPAMLIRTTVVKSESDGSQKFVYGASSLEPRCLAEDVVGNSASDLSAKTGLKLCK